MHKTVLFCDTNIIQQLVYKLLLNIYDGEVVYYENFCKQYICVISSYVLYELRKTLSRRYGNIIIRDEMIHKIEALGFHIIDSPNGLLGIYSQYVQDAQDEQILIDAITSKADILYTRNTRDFDMDAIYEDFEIIVTNTL